MSQFLVLRDRAFTIDDVAGLLSPYGDPEIKLCSFPSSFRVPTRMAGAMDDWMSFIKSKSGAFIAARVEL